MRPDWQRAKNNGAPEGAPCGGKAREERLPPRDTLAVRHRGERSRHIGVAQVHGGAPDEGPLALEEIDDEERDSMAFTERAASYCALHK